jgi:hypothetical protein
VALAKLGTGRNIFDERGSSSLDCGLLSTYKINIHIRNVGRARVQDGRKKGRKGRI